MNRSERFVSDPIKPLVDACEMRVKVNPSPSGLLAIVILRPLCWPMRRLEIPRPRAGCLGLGGVKGLEGVLPGAVLYSSAIIGKGELVDYVCG